MRIKRGDTVLIISGNDRGETGTVQRVVLRERRVVVNGVNMIKKHQKPMQTGGRSKTQPGIIEFEGPISISNVQLVCPSCHEPTRVGYALDEGGLKSRVCKRCDAVIG
jgi:large subunit ribosomal protein L24